MKRNLNQKLAARDGTPFLRDGKPLLFADVVVSSLDAYGQGPKRAIGKLADMIDAAKKPPKDVELSPEDAALICAAMDAGPFVSIAVKQVAEYLEAK